MNSNEYIRLIRDLTMVLVAIVGCAFFLSLITCDSDAASYDLSPEIYEDKEETFPMKNKVDVPNIGIIPYKVTLSS
ncbi:MAG: hypothetical protein J6R75_06005, partial [Candidatus Methanomethylophilaceae archaeon]|nr:hypothetical protein [Candidatus Methanomethylophilaceae archaeon]